MRDRSLLIAGLAMMVAGILLGGLIAPLLDSRPAAATAAGAAPRYPGGQFGPGFPHHRPGGGFFGPYPRRIPSPSPSPAPNA